MPLAVDAKMVSVLHCDGTPWSRADVAPGVSLQRAEHEKDVTYPELVGSDTVRLMTLACETGGRWSEACATIIAGLAAARAREAPRYLQLAARLAFERRWWALLSCTQQDTLAATLVDDAVLLLDGHDDLPPELVDVLVDEARAT